ncbi:hypothetical protein YC2023_029737 [Brassica napus]
MKTAVQASSSEESSEVLLSEEEYPPPKKAHQVPTPVSPLVQSPQQQHNGEEEQGSSSSDSSQNDSEEESVEENIQPIVEIAPVHSMTTRARSGIIKPNPKYALFTIKIGPVEPRSVKEALRDKEWTASMDFEIENMKETETFELVPPEDGQNPTAHVDGRSAKPNISVSKPSTVKSSMVNVLKRDLCTTVPAHAINIGSDVTMRSS